MFDWNKFISAEQYTLWLLTENVILIPSSSQYPVQKLQA